MDRFLLSIEKEVNEIVNVNIDYGLAEKFEGKKFFFVQSAC